MPSQPLSRRQREIRESPDCKRVSEAHEVSLKDRETEFETLSPFVI